MCPHFRSFSEHVPRVAPVWSCSGSPKGPATQNGQRRGLVQAQGADVILRGMRSSFPAKDPLGAPNTDNLTVFLGQVLCVLRGTGGLMVGGGQSGTRGHPAAL